MIAFVVLIGLILLNGIFALSELAVVSSRKARLQSMADERRPGARSALALAKDPGRFLSTVQIGITLVAILAGAISGATLSGHLDAVLEGWGVPTAIAEPLAYGVVLAGITYASVVIGELVPKNLALRNPERFACALAPPMILLSRVAAPVVWLLDSSTRAIFRIFGQSASSQSTITDEEIRSLLAEAARTGVIHGEERSMMSGILRLGDRSVSGIMTPRVDVEFIDLALGDEELLRRVRNSTHSRLPVREGSSDDIVGIIEVKDLLKAMAAGEQPDLRRSIRNAPVVPDTMGAVDALDRLRDSEVPIAMVYDEYGHFEGVVTPADILDVIAGAFRSEEDAAEPEAIRRADGSWLLSGAMPADEMADRIGFRLEETRQYQTVAGFFLAHHERMPDTGEWFETDGWRFEVLDMDGRRIDKLLASRMPGED